MRGMRRGMLLMLGVLAPVAHTGWMMGAPRRTPPQPIQYWENDLAQCTR